MKKIFSTLALAAVAMTGLAQESQQYFRVEFTVPITGNNIPSGQSNNSVAATMKDFYTYCNPEHEYLDFQASTPMGFRSTTGNYNEFSTFYLDNGRTSCTTPGNSAPAQMPFDVDKIKKITAYSIPVVPVHLLDSTATHEITFIGNGTTYRVSEFTFDRLPRNVAELKTLIEPNGDGVRVGCDNPLYVAAVMYLVWPRLLDNSQDCRDMIDYLFGTQYSQLSTVGISNQSFQEVCIGQFTDNKGKDRNGFMQHYQLFQHFAGATPGNQYKPNDKDYWTGPYTVRVAWDPQTPTEYSGQMNATIARLLLMPNPEATDKADISFEDPTAHLVRLRSTKKNGWFFIDGEKIYYTKGKDQRDDDF